MTTFEYVKSVYRTVCEMSVSDDNWNIVSRIFLKISLAITMMVSFIIGFVSSIISSLFFELPYNIVTWIIETRKKAGNY